MSGFRTGIVKHLGTTVLLLYSLVGLRSQTPTVSSEAHAETKSLQLQGRSGDELGWAASSVFPGARFAVLHGAPYRGPYAIRMKRPDGRAEQPHYHESEEYVSVISGTVHVGVGDRLNRTSAKAFRAGSYVVVPARALHYSLAEGELTIDVHWSGPAAAIYVKADRQP